MTPLNLRITDIEIGERHRALSEDAVERLAASMRDIGLRQPITVRVVDEMMLDGHLTAGVPVLVAGCHRLAAARLLGWTDIDCTEIEGDEITAELWEIAENLYRLDLSVEEKREHIRRYAELVEMRLQSRPQGPIESTRVDGRGHRPKGVVGTVADELGISTKVARAAIAPKPTPEAKAPLPDHDVFTVQFNGLMAAWNRAGSDVREAFLTEIDAPVFDSTRAAS